MDMDIILSQGVYNTHMNYDLRMRLTDQHALTSSRLQVKWDEATHSSCKSIQI